MSQHVYFFFSSRRRHTRSKRDWSSDVCSSDLRPAAGHLSRTRGAARRGPGGRRRRGGRADGPQRRRQDHPAARGHGPGGRRRRARAPLRPPGRRAAHGRAGPAGRLRAPGPQRRAVRRDGRARSGLHRPQPRPAAVGGRRHPGGSPPPGPARTPPPRPLRRAAAAGGPGGRAGRRAPGAAARRADQRPGRSLQAAAGRAAGRPPGGRRRRGAGHPRRRAGRQDRRPGRPARRGRARRQRPGRPGAVGVDGVLAPGRAGARRPLADRRGGPRSPGGHGVRRQRAAPAALPSGGARGRLVLAATSLIGLAGFTWPLLYGARRVGPDSAHAADAPWLFAILVALLLAIVAVEHAAGRMSAKTVAVLAVLAALNSVLRLPGGVAGFNALWFLLIVAARAYGPTFGFLLGSFTLACSALVTGGVGPWLPFQVLAAGGGGPTGLRARDRAAGDRGPLPRLPPGHRAAMGPDRGGRQCRPAAGDRPASPAYPGARRPPPAVPGCAGAAGPRRRPRSGLRRGPGRPTARPAGPGCSPPAPAGPALACAQHAHLRRLGG